jgi:ribosome-binding protein aMBF1 (putative translation factor)
MARLSAPSNTAAAKSPFVPVEPKRASPPKELTVTAPRQLGAAIVVARTTAGLSQIELAARLKNAEPNTARFKKGGSILSTVTLQLIVRATAHWPAITFIHNA